jgi:hypothetical protein
MVGMESGKRRISAGPSGQQHLLYNDVICIEIFCRFASHWVIKVAEEEAINHLLVFLIMWLG